MAPSLFSTLSSALLLTSTVSAVQTYQVVDSYDSTNFLDKFGFFVSDHTTGNYNDVDPTGGYVSYKSAEEAKSMGLLKTVGNDLYLGVDHTNKLDPKGTGRSSVRIQSKSKYKKGLFVANFSHLPKPVCGAWPAFWMVGNPWPAAGEIDIVESWNEGHDGNKVVIHTDSNVGECRIDGQGMTGTISKPNCANFAPGQADNEGCAGLDTSAPFGSPEGGVYAMEWTDDAIRVWGFTHANVPADLSDPSTFGTPSFTTSTCEADKVFAEQQLIMNIDLCGIAGESSGGPWDQSGCAAKTGMSCHEFVASNPEAFAEVFFQLSSIKIYQLKEGEAPAPTSSAAAVTSSAAAVPTSAGEVAPSSSAPAPAPETPAETSAAAPEKPSVPAASEPAAEKPTATAASEPAAEKPTATAAVPETPAETPTEDLTTRLATSTVYETVLHTKTSCAPYITNCPARETPEVVTEVIAISTTICPVVDVPTTMTVSRTQVVTLTSCPPSVPNCPVGSKTTLTTAEVVPTTTAIPVESYTKPPAKPPVVTPGPEAPVAITTYKTNLVTITSCPPTVPDCPIGKTSTVVTSEVITPGVPATPTEVPQNPPANPPVPGTEKPTTPAAPGVEKPTTPAAPGVEKPTTPAAPGVEKPTTPVVPGAEKPTTPVVPGAEKPTTPAVPAVPAVPGVPEAPATTPVPGQTTSAEQPVPETPAATPTTLVVAPSSPFNGTLTTARIPVGTGTPCIGSACPATTTGPVQAGAGKIGSSVFALAAALAVFVF